MSRRRFRFLKSLKYALRGIIYCINNERNMRIHTVATLYVFVFSFFFQLSRAAYAVLFLTFALVMMAEVMNTVAEELADMTASSFNLVVRIVKDLAAGGVLICAIFSVGVGVCLFWQPPVFLQILHFFLDRVWLMAALFLSLAVSAVYIKLGPLGILDYLHKKRKV